MDVHNENCLDTMDSMPANFIDLTVTSPPYDNMRAYNGYSFEFEAVATDLFRVTKQGGVVVWVVGDATINGSETGTSFKQAIFFIECGFKLHDTMIYEKECRGAIGSNYCYLQSFEYMFVFSKGRPKSINLICDRENKEARIGDNSTRRNKNGVLEKVKRGGYGKFGRRKNIWKYLIGKGHSSSDNIAYSHPAIFPEKLAEDHILSWSNEGDLIYDPFCGSGTTGLAAQKHNRRFIGSEISKEYTELSRRRLSII